MKIALISARPKIADKQANIKKIKHYIQQESADLYVFGELFLTGYNCKDEYRTLAEPLTGPSIKHLKKIAQQHNCYLIFGMPLQDPTIQGLITNAAVLIHPNGTVDSYSKWFLVNLGPFEEKIYFDEGEHINVFQTKFGKIGLTICYDIYFPELTKALSFLGADILINISASPSTTRPYFETLIPARAIENTAYYIYVNLVGTQEDLVFWGGSQIANPLGTIEIKAPYFKESIITHTLDLNQIKIARENRPILRDIRPHLYQDLYQFARFHQPLKKQKKT